MNDLHICMHVGKYICMSSYVNVCMRLKEMHVNKKNGVANKILLLCYSSSIDTGIVLLLYVYLLTTLLLYE